MKKLNRDFYLKDTLSVAQALLGKYMVHETPKGRRIGKIVETEAYIGPEDKGCHSYGGKRTKKNEVMYHIGGTAYIYLIYGMYFCFNVVTEEADKATAALIRALEPVEGFEEMSLNRYGMPYDHLTGKQQINLANGPGKLCIAMSLQKEDNGTDLCGSRIYIAAPEKLESFEMVTTTRINIDYAQEYKDMPWRFYIKGNKYVSVK